MTTFWIAFSCLLLLNALLITFSLNERNRLEE